MNQTTLTKTCRACGTEKPLSAFLQMSGTKHGTAYGNICASCRKAAKEQVERRKKTEAEGGTTSETGHRIDSKAKVQDAKDRRKHHQKTEDEYHEERKLDEEESENKQEKTLDKEDKEKKHRESFLNKRKHGSTTSRKATEKRERQQHAAEESASRTEQHNEDIAAQAHGAHEESKRTQVDLSVTYHGQQIAGSIKHTQNVYLRQFADWLGNAAPIVRNVSGMGKSAGVKQSGSIASPFAQANAGEPVQKTAAKQQAANKQTASHRNFLGNQTQSNQAAKDPAQQHVEKNWRPSGGGRKK